MTESQQRPEKTSKDESEFNGRVHVYTGNGKGKTTAALSGSESQMIILDEIMVALHQGLLSGEAVRDLLDRRPETVELVLTGRHASPEIVARADLVTEMHEVKHYYRNGVPARIGIEK